MNNSTQPFWRSLLFCPANSEKFIARAHERKADAVILDLEDSISILEKPQAREKLKQSIVRISQGGPDVLVRINRDLDLAVADIAAAVCPELYGLVIPKVKGPEHLQLLVELIEINEQKFNVKPGHTKLLALVETPEGIARINEIAKASPRLVGMAVGGEDLATELDAEPNADSLYVAKMLGVLAARAAGILPIGVIGSVADINNNDQHYKEMLGRSRRLGFAGATCVHPRQVAMINEAFSPGSAQVNAAKRIVQAYEDAKKNGKGAFEFDGRMIDAPIVARAQRLLVQLDQQKNFS
ncbi:CoA ester lyase [Advenella sp. WQ 585]|uniref:CoA ester lyase n=1 Tax=Advenella mandrilli TaxID=2800330 RepID=A0ABS1EHI6_9BURK|nr:CoA ester lyase [Advenella mandrilli]MBK1782470.1 CoA ester lyase [Advenella mandrilli]